MTGSEADLNLAGETYFSFNKAVQGGMPDTGAGVLPRTLLVLVGFFLRVSCKSGEALLVPLEIRGVP